MHQCYESYIKYKNLAYLRFWMMILWNGVRLAVRWFCSGKILSGHPVLSWTRRLHQLNDLSGCKFPKHTLFGIGTFIHLVLVTSIIPAIPFSGSHSPEPDFSGKPAFFPPEGAKIGTAVRENGEAGLENEWVRERAKL